MKTAVTVHKCKLMLLASTGVFALTLSLAPAQAQLFCPNGGSLNNGGTCNVTTPSGTAFSTAALSSQALSEVSQTVTQQSTEAAFAAVQDRREQETTAPARRSPAPAPVSRAPTRDPKSPMVFKAPVPPAYAGPTYAVWGHGFGDWEKRDDDTATVIGGNTNPIDIHRRMTTSGFLGGVDTTYRNGSATWMLGLIGGYMLSDVKLTSSSIGTPGNSNPSSASIVNATISGPSVGAYANYANGPWSADLTVKADFMSIDQSFSDTFFETGSPDSTTVSGSASVDMINVTVGGNVNYRIPMSATHWWEPTGGFRYTHSDFGSNAAVLGLTDGNVFRLQGGLRFGWEQVTGRATWRTTLTGLAYSDVSVDGLVLDTGGFAGNAVLPSDEGKVRGMGILATSYDNGVGTVLYGQVDVRGGENLFGVGGRLGARISLN